MHCERVAVVIPAKNESDRIGATVRAARAIPRVDLIVVVDDGSTDNTGEIARAAGATVVRHSVNHGKASALETGSSVVAMRDADGVPPRAVLFLDADTGDSAIECAALIEPVVRGTADMTIAYLPPQQGAGGHGIVTGYAKRWIWRLTGWIPRQPLSGQRCLNREALEAAFPLAAGWGVEVGMTIDLLCQGFTVQEIPCPIFHRASGRNLAGQIHRATQYRDVIRAVVSRRLRRIHVPKKNRNTTPPQPGMPFTAFVR
ncbi:glycosyltransferase family 2 protein [Trueperella sp. LYQ143]|uniref:glycosyltransferase family 2 protein n=1 Tax=unclassified Trueperella TaxID=2630174 RepID=UPI0039839CFF